LKPGAGLIVSTLLASLNTPGTTEARTAPDLIVGKPNPFAFNLIRKELPEDIKTERIVMVGDNINTDILFGQNSGIDTILVLTGVTENEEMMHQICAEKNIELPTHVMQSIGKDFL